MVVVTSVKKARRAAALRVVAPDPPLRLPRRRAGAAAPAVDRPDFLRLAARDGLLVGPVCRVRRGRPRLPGRPAAVALAARAARRRSTCGPRARASRLSPSAAAACAGCRCAPASSSSGASSTAPAGAGATPTPSPRPPTAGPCASPPPTSATASARLADAAARHPRARRGPLRPHARRACARAARSCSWAPGIGITPLRALLEELDQAPGDVTVVHRVRSRSRPVLADEIARARRGQGRPLPRSSRARACRTATAGCPPRRRHLGDAEALLELVPDVADHDVYVCGATAWMDAARPRRRRRRAGRPSTSSASPTDPDSRRLDEDPHATHHHSGCSSTITGARPALQLPHVDLDAGGGTDSRSAPAQATRLAARPTEHLVRLDGSSNGSGRAAAARPATPASVGSGTSSGSRLDGREDLRRRRGHRPAGDRSRSRSP